MKAGLGKGIVGALSAMHKLLLVHVAYVVLANGWCQVGNEGV